MIGEAPSRSGDRFDPISGRAERLLCDLAGWKDGLGPRFLRLNLLEENPGPSSGGKGDAWPLDLARQRAAQMVFAGRPAAVLLGRRVAAAFGARGAYCEWWDPSDEVRAPYVVIPHPSGVNRLYNDPAVRDQVGVVLRDAAKRGER